MKLTLCNDPKCDSCVRDRNIIMSSHEIHKGHVNDLNNMLKTGFYDGYRSGYMTGSRDARKHIKKVMSVYFAKGTVDDIMKEF